MFNNAFWSMDGKSKDGVPKTKMLGRENIPTSTFDMVPPIKIRYWIQPIIIPINMT